jgi:hypothetical protein
MHHAVSDFVASIPQFSPYDEKKKGEKHDRYTYCKKFMEKISGGNAKEFMKDLLQHTKNGQEILSDLKDSWEGLLMIFDFTSPAFRKYFSFITFFITIISNAG